MNTVRYNAKISKKDVTDSKSVGTKSMKQRNTAII